MSMTRRAHDFGFGFLFLISYFSYDDDFTAEELDIEEDEN